MRGKLLLLLLTTTGAALLMAGVAMVAYDVYTFRESVANDLDAQADILGLAVAPALQFEDPDAAREYLELLKARPSVVSAAIYTTKGALFATYPAQAHGHGEASFPMLPEADGYRFDDNHLTLSKRIVQDGEILGTVYFNAAYEPFSRLRDYVGILSLVLVLSLAATALLSARFQKTFTAPILDITQIAKRVMEQRNFSLRARRMTDDEVGVLVTAFNAMLSEIGKQTETLEASNQQLQREFAERQRAEQAKDRSERRVHTLVSAITQVVWVADRYGAFVEERDSWQAYTGQTREQYQGLGWRDAFDGEAARRSTSRGRARWCRPRRSSSSCGSGTRRRGAIATSCCAPCRWWRPDGTSQEWIGAIQDIDDRRGLEQNLRTLNAELEQRVADRTAQLEEANKELESFSYSVSHDLRAPIRAIGGFCTLLGRDHGAALDAEAQRKLGIIKGEAERMGALIDDLLAFSRLGRKGMQPADLDMAALANDRLSALEPGAERPRSVEFHVGKLPHAFGDRSLFEQVWVNLLVERAEVLVEEGATR